MSQNAPESQQNAQRRKAAELLALNELSDEQIAAACGVNRRTISRWKKTDFVQQVIAEATKEIGETLRADGIRSKQFRIEAQEKRWADLETIRKERAADSFIASFPGGETGFVAVDLKQVKHLAEPKENDQGVQVWTEDMWVHSFDVTLWNAYLSVERHIAQETGQWTEKHEVDQTTVIEFLGIDPDKL